MRRKPKGPHDPPLAPVPSEILDQRSGDGAQQGDLSRPRRAARWFAGHPRAWIEQTEGAKCWMTVFSDLKARALAAVFPETTLQTCLVHFIRQSLDFANWKERKPMAAALRTIYGASSAEAAGAALDGVERGPWGQQFPTVMASWRRAWTHVIPFFAFPPELRRVLDTTKALESVHASLRKIIKTRGHFPNAETATKLIWPALRNITAKWTRGAIHWRARS